MYFQYSVLNAFVNDRIDKNRDVKIIITARNSETGTGKSTLALELALWWDRNGWSPDKGFYDVKRYEAFYNLVAEKGDVLVFDDAQAGVDNRRSMAKENVTVSKYWTLNRTKNVITIMTMPTQSMLDKRMLELGDIWINVRRRGMAVPYRLLVKDVSKEIITYRLRHPVFNHKEQITFDKFEGESYVEMDKRKLNFVEDEFQEDFGGSLKQYLDSKYLHDDEVKKPEEEQEVIDQEGVQGEIADLKDMMDRKTLAKE